MNRETEIHDKAIQLIEGGMVEVDNLWVVMIRSHNILGACYDCDLDRICHTGNAIRNLCMECDLITGADCFLVLMDKK